jgi:hypothetical protein
MTASLGDWGDGAEGPPPTASPRSVLDTALASVDVEASARDAARSAMRKRLDAIAATAVDDILTEPMLIQLREAADEAARGTLFTPVPSDVPPQPELYYPTLMAFVTEYLTPLYRRSVTGHGDHLVRGVVEARGGHQPPRSALAVLGASAPGPAHGHVGVATRSRRPPHGSPAQRRWPVHGVIHPALSTGSAGD